MILCKLNNAILLFFVVYLELIVVVAFVLIIKGTVIKVDRRGRSTEKQGQYKMYYIDT